jgi:hypothetical protein
MNHDDMDGFFVDVNFEHKMVYLTTKLDSYTTRCSVINIILIHIWPLCTLEREQFWYI